MTPSRTVATVALAVLLGSPIASRPAAAAPGTTEGPPAAAAAPSAPDSPNPEPSADSHDRPPVGAGAGIEPAIPRPHGNSRSVYFGSGSAQLDDQARAAVAGLAARLLRQPRLSATLRGYSADPASSAYAIALGQRRAEAVAAELQRLGVAPGQIRSVTAARELFPTAPCLTEICNASYRRVEIEYPR
ncbi:MAG TPA: OmpA family protein [Rhodocyclaceae bacterium]|nr:OmpA family protein [Rhodocyclaceae bacterium]HNH35269.1 OmpA family protein [Rhodocyclaceae bacterium]